MTDEALRLHDLKFGIRRSIRYHDRRKRFFEACSVATTWLALIFGSATFISLTGEDHQTFTKICAGLVTLSSSLDLVIGFGRKAWLHDDLKKRFIALETKALRLHDCNAIEEERLTIEAEEPPIKRNLDILCHNELLIASGYDKDGEHYHALPWYKALTAQII